MAQRLDKLLSLSGERTRSQSNSLIKAGRVTVNGVKVRNPSEKVAENSIIILDGQLISTQAYQYAMMNKPSGVLTAAEDHHAETVMDLLPAAWKNRGIMPIGRLDKDTTGLLLFTNDGVLAHRLLDPKRGVWKRYIAVVTGLLDAEDERRFQQGIPLKDFCAQPAALRILKADLDESVAEVCVHEGKFHQVKRMFAACGHEVTALHRASIGPIELSQELAAGQYRLLTIEEVQSLKNVVHLGAVENAE